jgi:ectoine hydroxylase-related dioxygenase (phytanoyl-CoA dioxygenase family)
LLTKRQKDDFVQKGYVLVPEVFSREQIANLRQSVATIFEMPLEPGDIARKGVAPAARLDIFNRYPQLRWILTHQPLVEALESLLGEDFIYLPEAAIQDSGFGGWHKDTSSQERAGHLFHWEPDFMMAQLAVYLQDNSEYGGGLEVIPGSHRRKDVYVRNRLRDRLNLNRIRNDLDNRGVWRSGYSVPSRAGDLVMFDFRLDHRATYPFIKAQPPEEHRKLAVFLACSANNRHAGAYRSFLASRPSYPYLRDHRYSPELVAQTTGNKFSLMP